MPLSVRTDCFYFYFSLSSGCLDRWQIYLSHISPHKEGSELHRNRDFEIPSCHNSPHRWDLGLLSFSTTLNELFYHFQHSTALLLGESLPFSGLQIAISPTHKAISCLAWSSSLLGVAPHQNEGPSQSLADLPREHTKCLGILDMSLIYIAHNGQRFFLFAFTMGFANTSEIDLAQQSVTCCNCSLILLDAHSFGHEPI